MSRHAKAFALLLFAATAAHAQEVRATVSGIITDPAGAPIPAAEVTVTSGSSGTVYTTTSNDSGSYQTPFLAPGSYNLSVVAKGFKKFVVENIVLATLEKARVDVHLEIGAMAEQITVSGTVAVLETETASRGQTLSNELIANLPTQGRNPFQIAWAAPGVVKTGGWRYLRSFDIAGTSGFSINGGRDKENEVLLDGISNVQSNRTVIHVPTMDSVQEFKVLTNIYDAQYGRTGGGIVTIITKSGGNQLHGTAYEYFQNDKLNANQFELNAGGIPKSPNHINDFGFQASGPVYVPKVIDGRNRVFWMLAYEGMRQRSADPGIANLPLTEWKAGDFSTLFNSQGQRVNIYDPLTTAADGTRQPFANNRLPANRINKVASEVAKFYPVPPSQGVGPAHIQNYPYPSRWVGDLNQWIGRVDVNITPRNIVYFRYGQNPYSEFRSLVFVTDLSQSNPAEPTGNAPLIRNGRNLTFDWTSTLSPHATFDLRAGLNRWEETTGNSFGENYDPRQLGFDPALVGQFTRLQFPYFDLGTYQPLGSSRLLSYSANDAYTLQPNVNAVIGRHTVKVGVEVRKYNDNSLNPGMAAGTYTFGKNWTQAVSNRADSTSGNELATFLLGYPTTGAVDRNIDPSFTHFYWAGFVQDDWKATPRLTVNVGLRWDYESPATERYNRMVRGLDLFVPSPIAAQVTGLTLKGSVLFAGVNGQPKGSFTPDKNNIAPRIGLAYRVNDKTVVRGGYGIYYLGQSATGTNQGFSQRTNAVISTDNLRPAVDLINPFALQPGGKLLDAVGASEGGASFLGQAVTANWLERPLPYSHQYSFDIQRQMPGNMLFEVGYIGNQTRKLPISANANYVPVSELNRRTSTGAIDNAYYSAQVANPMAGLIPQNAALNGPGITRQTTFFAYPQFAGVSVANMPVGQQRYDSVQMKVTKRFERGFTFLASYTIGKTLEQVSLLNAQDLVISNPGDTPLVKQSADQIDIPQKFNFTGVYELPIGRGKPVGSNMSKVMDYVVGGWEVNWNITYSKGWNVAYPNAAQVKPGSAQLSDPTIAQWFDTSLWNDPGTGRRVGAQEPFTLRNFPLRFGDVRLPGYENWDISASKYFPIKERLRLQYRFEMVNAFNHPWFTGIASVDVTNSQFGRLTPTQNNLPRFLKMGLNLQW